MPLPKRIQNAPQLLLGLELYFSAFVDLTNDRVNGMGIGRIPFMTILHYADYIGCSQEQTDDMLFYVQQMDMVYVNWQNERQKEK